MARVILAGIEQSYGATQVLRGIDLAVADGEFVSLVGPSGCGKSTLLRTIAGLGQASSGEVIVGERSVSGLHPSERDLAMVFQSYALYPHLSVRENLAVPLTMRRLSFMGRLPFASRLLPSARRARRDIDADVERTAALLGIEALLDRKPGQLSGGQRQRVAVGRAIVREPKAFLFDEPLSNLDALLRVHMRTELAQLHRQLGATFIYVTHDQAEAMTMSDRIAVMLNGRLAQVGTPDEVYHRPASVEVARFIGSPAINLLQAETGVDGRVRVLGQALDLKADGVSTLGVRPEALHVGAADGGALNLTGVVTHVENLGAERFVHLATELDGPPLVARVVAAANHRVRRGDSLTFNVRPLDTHLFNREGDRIEAAASVVNIGAALA